MTDRHAVHFKSGKMDWETPPEFFERLRDEFDLTLDVCANVETAKLSAYIEPPWHHPCGPLTASRMLHADGLAQEWDGRDWMNCPYGRTIGLWTSKAAAECEAGNAELVVGLLPARPDTAWWHDDCMRAAEIRLVRGRLKFVGALTGAPFPSVVVIWRRYHTGPPVLTTMRARL